MTELLIAAGVVFTAGAVQGLAGFGFGMVCMCSLPMLFPLEVAVPVIAVFQVVVASSLAWRLRAHLDLRKVAPMVAGSLLGLPLGVTMLKVVDPHIVKGLLGLVLVSYVSWSSARRPVAATASGASAPELSSRWGVVAGFSGGILGGAVNAYGPPAVIYSSLKPWDRDQVRGTLQLFSICTASMATVGFVIAQLVTLETLSFNLWLLPLPILGMVVGARLCERIDNARFNRVLLIGLFGMGLFYLGVALIYLV